MTRPSEKEFEEHFCAELEQQCAGSKMVFIKRATKDVDLSSLVDGALLTQFLEKTQPEELKELKIDLGDEWLAEFKAAILKALGARKVFEILRDGVDIRGKRFKLAYFKPETSFNPDEMARYKSNVFSYARQFAFAGTLESIDVVLFLNGLPIITIELKNQFNGQNADDAVHQYTERDKAQPIFRVPFLHIASDTTRAMVATQFIENSMDDFMHFNTDIDNPTQENEFSVDYLYHDVLRPESLLGIIEAYLFCFEAKDKTGRRINRFLFPRYHQRRTVINLMGDLGRHIGKSTTLGKKYLIQHSPGSGKSYTIAVLQRFLRNAHVENRHIFSSVIVVTDRVNLDSQIKGTIGSSESQQGIIAHAEDTKQLAKALNENRKVIITTIQKFSVKKLDELLVTQKGKNICFIIDEAHRSQAGKLHSHMVEKFDDEEDVQNELLEGIGKKSYPNFVFVALTATPSDKALEMFGKPFDVYTMDQAEKEGYILNVVENVVTYQTLYKLNHDVESSEEYPPLVIAKKLKAKAYEDEKLITDKIGIILKVFKAQTECKINNSAKVMIVTSSRKAAVKYKLMMDSVLGAAGLPHKTLVAFSGTVRLAWKGAEEASYTEKNLNNIKAEIEDEFKKPEYRFIIVANKFQYGFNQPYLHTMFLDKAVSGINAVQTISRLNRTLVGKTDTLVVDFTNSYEQIISAFRKFKREVNDYSQSDIRELPRMKKEILAENVFTMANVEAFKKAVFSSDSPTATASAMLPVLKNAEKMPVLELRNFRSLVNRFNSTHKYLQNIVRIADQELSDFYLFTNYLAKCIDPIGRGGKIDEEIKKVMLVSHKIRLEKKHPVAPGAEREAPKTRRAIQYATIDEVIEAINAVYENALGDNQKNLIKQYMDVIINDPIVRAEIAANKKNDLWRLYSTSISSKLKEKGINFFLMNDPAHLPDYIDRGLIEQMNEEAYKLAIRQAS
jgi:type I restriction enzyme R subunit